MKLIKVESYNRDKVYYQIGWTNFYLDEGKTMIYLLIPYTGDKNEFDVELYEDESSGSMHTIAEEMYLTDFLEVAEFLKKHIQKKEKRSDK